MKLSTRILIAILSLTPALALATPTLSSRNIPKTCEFVFEVETDIRIENLETPILEISYFNEYEKTWTTWVTMTPNSDFSFNWSLLSFSQNPKYLYRIVRFREAGSDVIFRSEFGRQFGEACQQKDNTPFRNREVILENKNP